MRGKGEKVGHFAFEYIMPGLGGKAMWREHAIETARVLSQIDPDFIRVRTFKPWRLCRSIAGSNRASWNS